MNLKLNELLFVYKKWQYIEWWLRKPVLETLYGKENSIRDYQVGKTTMDLGMHVEAKTHSSGWYWIRTRQEERYHLEDRRGMRKKWVKKDVEALGGEVD